MAVLLSEDHLLSGCIKHIRQYEGGKEKQYSGWVEKRYCR